MSGEADSPVLRPAIPVLRIYDIDRAKDFYCGFLGFTIDWEHRYEPGMPLYMQVSRSGTKLHLSEHYGDGTPGTAVYIAVEDIGGFLRDITARGSAHARPNPCSKEATITDPFGNMLRFDGSRV